MSRPDPPDPQAQLDLLREAYRRVGMLLAEIEAADLALEYPRRNAAVYRLLAIAVQLGWPCGPRDDPTDPDWPLVFVDLPDAGQVAWHLPAYGQPWDNHSTRAKYDRCHTFVRLYAAPQRLNGAS